MEERHQLVQVRLEKLERLKSMGINPYPYEFEVTARAKELVGSYKDSEHQEQGARHSLAGRIVSLRSKGKVTFAHIDDGDGRIQIYARKEVLGDETYEVVKLLDLGDIIGVKGYLFRTQTGEITIHVERLSLLAKNIRPLPVVKEKIVDDRKVVYDKVEDKELRYRQRYVDLIVNPEVKEAFRARTRIINHIRSFLDARGYLEVETPVLQPIYGGAAARPFTTQHNALDCRLYLRISNELYLKRLIVGGFNRVYEFSKDFRNEGLDRSHNPEFTMLEFYQAYADYYKMLDLVEELVAGVTEEVLGDRAEGGIEWNGKKIRMDRPWPRRKVVELIGEAVGHDLALPLERDQLARLCRKNDLEVAPEMGAGKLLDQLFSELVEPELIDPAFVMDYPIETSPLAKRHRDNPELVERFELIIGGMEIANAFSELNDPLDQRDRFQAQMKLRDLGDDEAQVLDEDYLRAMEYGLPPTGGVGIGIDRLIMLLTGLDSIKDVILFPQLRPE
ncbi:MAG TPA: lysine--tRNA ligase [archaeon]|nr:lysine--tRNA ligase [archaeon]